MSSSGEIELLQANLERRLERAEQRLCEQRLREQRLRQQRLREQRLRQQL
jgi:hypothetical protein